MSIAALFEDLVDEIDLELVKVRTGYAAADRFVGIVLGDAEAVDEVVAAIDPAIGAPILAALAALAGLRAVVEATVAAGDANPTAIASQVVQLTTQAADVATQLGPFYRVERNSADVAVAALKAQALVSTPA